MAFVGSGVLGPGHATYFDVDLRRSITYGIYVVPDQPGMDFDLRIYDERGNSVTRDVRIDHEAMRFLTPRTSGTFRLKVDADGGYGSCRIAIQG